MVAQLVDDAKASPEGPIDASRLRQTAGKLCVSGRGIEEGALAKGLLLLTLEDPEMELSAIEDLAKDVHIETHPYM